MSIIGKLFGRSPKPEKQEPAVVENDLGSFTMEYLDKLNTRPAYAYIGYVRWNAKPEGADIEAEVSCDNTETLNADAGFERLRAILADAGRLDNRIKAFILKHTIDKDDGKVRVWGSWRDFGDGEQIVPPGEFVRRLSVDGLHISEDGETSFCVDLDEMFTDHAMMVSMSADGELTDCYLIG